MIAWLKPLRQCWSWISYTFLADLEKTRLIECRASVLDSTQVLDCRPTVRCVQPAAAQKPRDWSIPRRAEKRIALRYPCDRPVYCLKRGSRGMPITGRARNVSACGIGLVVSDHVEPGTVLVLEMSSAFEEGTARIPARVVHARPMPIKGWFLGCEFAKTLSDAEVRALI